MRGGRCVSWAAGLTDEAVEQITRIMRETNGKYRSGHTIARGFWVLREPSTGDFPHLVVLRLKTPEGQHVREWVIVDERGKYVAREPIGTAA